jgi:hypothetical protein
MKVLVAEDWWADRLRFELLLGRHSNIDVTFAWRAGRGNGVWHAEAIADAVVHHDALLLDMALTRADEDTFLDVRRRPPADVLAAELTHPIFQISGIRVLQLLADKERQHGARSGTYTKRCIIVSAYTYDVLKQLAASRWSVRDTFHKWLDEDRIIETLFTAAPDQGGNQDV